MTVNKKNGFAAPYRSATLRGEVDAIIGQNGVLAISGVIGESGGNIVVPPFMAVQEGLLLEKTNITSIVKPLTLAAPYYLTVSATTPVNTDDLVFQFARSPLDISNNECILAEYDGNEWRPRIVNSIHGLIEDRSLEVVQKGQTGPYSGVITSISGMNYLNTKGLLFDNTGDKAVFEEDLLMPIIASDAEPTWRRVDRVVYRRPRDSVNRIGTRKLVIGGSFAPTGPQVLNSTALDLATNAKSVIASDNTSHTFYTVGYGASFQIRYKKFSSDRSTIITSATIANATSDKFSITIDSSNHIHLVYVDSGNIKLLVLNNVGATLYGPTVVDGLTNASSNPQVTIDPQFTKLFVTFEYLEGPSNRQVYFGTRSLTGALITPSLKITNTLTDITNPFIDVSSDLLVHLVYQDSGIIKYRVLDDIGQAVVAEQTVSASSGSQSFGTLVNNARNPIVKVTDNKEIFIAFGQKKGVTDYGISIWKNGYAFMPNFISIGENISSFSMVADSFDNDLYFTVAQAGTLDYVLVKDLTPVAAVNIQLAGAQSTHIVKDNLGSLLHSWSDSSPGTYTNSGSAQAVSHIGPIAVAGAINPLVLSTNQIAFLATITPAPVVGMRMVVAGSLNGNSGTYYISAVELQSIDVSNDYYVVTTTADFIATESPAVGVTSQFATPDGSQSHFIKSVANTAETRALSTIVPTSDVLLARVSWPGPIILNYIPQTGIGVNSDLFGMYGDIDVDWGATSPNTLTMTSGLRVIDLVTSTIYTVAAGSFPLVDGDALYITMNGVNTNITPSVAQISSLPWSTPIQVLGFRKNGEFNPHLFSVAGMGQLDVGESIVLGQDLSKAIRVRLGITSETSMAPYTSAVVINPSDPYSTAISSLDAAVGLFGTQVAQEEDFLVGSGGQAVFTTTAMDDFSANNIYLDITVYVNGRKMTQDTSGGLGKDFRKTAVDTIEFADTIPEFAVVTIRNERTGAPPIGGGVDLTNITVDPQPITNASNSLGTSTKAWKSVFVKDTLSAQVYELKVVGGVLQAVLVP